MGGGLFFILAVMGLSYIWIRSTIDDSARHKLGKAVNLYILLWIIV